MVIWNPNDSTAEPSEIAGLASTRTFPLRSSFCAVRNMTINLVSQMTPQAARALLRRSLHSIRRIVQWWVWCAAASAAKMLDDIAAEMGWNRRSSSTDRRSWITRAAGQDRRAGTRGLAHLAAAAPPGRHRRAGRAAAGTSSTITHGRRGLGLRSSRAGP